MRTAPVSMPGPGRRHLVAAPTELCLVGRPVRRRGLLATLTSPPRSLVARVTARTDRKFMRSDRASRRTRTRRLRLQALRRLRGSHSARLEPMPRAVFLPWKRNEPTGKYRRSSFCTRSTSLHAGGPSGLRAGHDVRKRWQLKVALARRFARVCQ